MKPSIFQTMFYLPKADEMLKLLDKAEYFGNRLLQNYRIFGNFATIKS